MGEYVLGALHVIQETRDKPWVDKLLARIDPHLFVEKQLTFSDEEVWCVVEDTGERRGGEQFVVVYEFRDGNDRPIPVLTEAIVDEIRRRAQDGTGNAQAAGAIVRRRNLERLERMREEAREASEDITRDFERHGLERDGHFATLPRSPALARSRAAAASSKAERLQAIREADRLMRALSR